MPRVLKDFVRVFAVLLAVGAITSEVFEASISGFLAASRVMGLVLGFALCSMIADFFSGIALNIERSFPLGDRMELETGERGEVVEPWGVHRQVLRRKAVLGSLVVEDGEHFSATVREEHQTYKKRREHLFVPCTCRRSPTSGSSEGAKISPNKS
jgi:hypothetical protein